MANSTEEIRLLETGVWQAPYTEDGRPVLVAVIDGERIAERVHRTDDDIQAIRRALWSAVDGAAVDGAVQRA